MPDDSPQTYRPKPPKGYTLFHVVEAVPKTRVMKVLNLNTAAVVTAMLKTVVENGTGRSIHKI